MFVGVFLTILVIVNMLILCCSVAMLFTELSPYFPPVLVIALLIYLTIFICFSKHTNKVFAKQKENLLSISFNKISEKSKQTRLVEFEKKGNKWISTQLPETEFDLGKYLFKKSFILAYIIRQVRYPTISKSLKAIKLFEKKLKVVRYENVIVRFIDGEKIKEYEVVKNYVSKNTTLSKSITKAKWYDHFLDNRSSTYIRRIIEMNENVFLRR